ncbi:hypothetical protein BCN_4984 [Bacillus cereus NC7401]|nr:hypothetical protein BCN_4984 [Bacillus cereus NC7401]
MLEVLVRFVYKLQKGRKVYFSTFLISGIKINQFLNNVISF